MEYLDTVIFSVFSDVAELLFWKSVILSLCFRDYIIETKVYDVYAIKSDHHQNEQLLIRPMTGMNV